jgi:hypothetical protein
MSDFRRQAFALPETEEVPHHGSASFRVRGKIFAQLSADGLSGLVKLPRPLQDLVVGEYPEACHREAGRWGDAGWTRLNLSKFPEEKVADLLAVSWRLFAPVKLSPIL